MRLTSDKANELICPFIEGYDYEWTKAGDPKNIRCISTKCMAWVKCYPLDENNTQGYCKRIYDEK